MAMGFFNRSTYCLVTGASRGLGREIAIQLSQQWSKAGVECDLVLLARAMEGLEETKAQVLAGASGVHVHLIQADLGDLQKLEGVFSEAVQLVGGRKHEQAVLIHNAGTVGDITKPIVDQVDSHEVQSYMAINFTSVFTLTSLFLSHFKEGFRTVINITSLLGVKFLPSFGMYSAGKAARNALMGVLAAENPGVRILSYSPGPCDTSMHTFIQKHTYSQSVLEMYETEFSVITCSESINKLVTILQEDKFDSGCVIDYLDPLPT